MLFKWYVYNSERGHVIGKRFDDLGTPSDQCGFRSYPSISRGTNLGKWFPFGSDYSAGGVNTLVPPTTPTVNYYSEYLRPQNELYRPQRYFDDNTPFYYNEMWDDYYNEMWDEHGM